MKIFPNIKNLAALLLVSVCAFGVRLDLVAMPTAEELAEVKPLVAELIKPDMDAMRAGKKSKADAAKASMALVSQAETPAAKLLLTRNAFQLYMKGRDYDAADAALDAMLAAVPDYPADELQELLEKALYPVPSKKAPQIRARVAALKQKAAAATQLKKILALLEKTPDDPALNLRLGTVYALQNDWKCAAPAFAKGSDVALAKAAKAELDLEISPAKAADFYWSVELPKKDAQLQSSLRAHAADLYKLSLSALTGLAKVQAERRIGEANAQVASSAPRTSMSRKTAKSYAQKGLISQWDGIENAGNGKHLSTTKIWVDLKGRANFALNQNSVVEDKAIYCNGKGIAGVSEASIPSLEIVCMELVFEYVSHTENTALFCTGQHPNGYFDRCFGIVNSRNSFCCADSVVAQRMSGIHYLSYNFKTKKISFDGGVSKSDLRTTLDALPGRGNSFAIGGFQNAPVCCRLYSIRLYDRDLTDLEIEQNLAIDKSRFAQ